jgi:nicotinamidase-related amidase
MARVWEPFLTEQDRAALARSARPPKRLLEGATNAALLLVDCYRAAYGTRPLPLLEAVEEWPSSCGLAAWDAIEPTRRLLDAARAAGLLVVYTSGAIDTEGLAGQHVRPARAPNDTPAIRYEIVEQLAPREGEWVVRKVGSSAFFGTPLVGHLVAHRIDTLIVVGESTSGCVRASVVDADEYRFNVVVVEECTFDRHEATHALNLFDINQKFGEVIGVAEVLDWIDRRTAATAHRPPEPVLGRS